MPRLTDEREAEIRSNLAMTEQEAYEAGIEKLGLLENRRSGYAAHIRNSDGMYIYAAPDLRTDPAFAWQVLEALPDVVFRRLRSERKGHKLSDALYTAVVALGREISE